MTYEIMISKEVDSFLDDIDDKSSRICRNNLKKLREDPLPGGGRGDKEKLRNSDLYRLHISREYTAIYEIDEDECEVRVKALLTIDKAHKVYGRYTQ